jgi:hypothetical protein
MEAKYEPANGMTRKQGKKHKVPDRYIFGPPRLGRVFYVLLS